jgi:hypothetical protein
MGGRTSQKCLIIHTQSTFRWLDTLNFLPLAANIEVSPNQVHTGIPHTFCLITTTIAWVFVKKQNVKSRRKARLYPHSRHFDALMLSTSVPQFQTWIYFRHMSKQVHHTHSVSQPLPSHAYLCRNRRSKVAKKYFYKHEVDFSLLSCSQTNRLQT